MLWIKYKCLRIGFFISLLVLPVVFLGLFYSDTVSAVSDVTGSISASTPNYTPFCNDNDSNVPNCSDFTYLVLESSDVSSPASTYWIIDFDTNSNSRLPFLTFLAFDISSYSTVWFRYPAAFGSVVYDYRLTNSLSPDQPVGTITISENGTYDVSSYAEAVVDVPPEVVQGDYHDDLVDIKESILVCGAICLVLYFFFCIYRLIIRNSGVK